MAKKPLTRFEPFNDGLVSFWQLDENRRPVPLVQNIRYQDRVIGFKRNYCAEQASHLITKLIRIPRMDAVARGTFAVISGQQFQVLQAQTILDTTPQCTDVTLEQPDILLKFDTSVAGSGGRI